MHVPRARANFARHFFERAMASSANRRPASLSTRDPILHKVESRSVPRSPPPAVVRKALDAEDRPKRMQIGAAVGIKQSASPARFHGGVAPAKPRVVKNATKTDSIAQQSAPAVRGSATSTRQPVVTKAVRAKPASPARSAPRSPARGKDAASASSSSDDASSSEEQAVVYERFSDKKERHRGPAMVGVAADDAAAAPLRAEARREATRKTKANKASLRASGQRVSSSMTQVRGTSAAPSSLAGRRGKTSHAASHGKASKVASYFDTSEADVWNLRPFVDVFKYWDVTQWKKSQKVGDVTQVMDKVIRKNTLRISGSVPAANNVQIPKSPNQSLGLTGRYAYTLMRVHPGRFFLLNFDVVTEYNLVVRICISNLFKETKVLGNTINIRLPIKHSKWTVLGLDLESIVRRAGGRHRFVALKSVKLCSFMSVRGIYTSAQRYTPSSLPKDIQFVHQGQTPWAEAYDWIWLPSAKKRAGAPVFNVVHSPETGKTAWAEHEEDEHEANASRADDVDLTLGIDPADLDSDNEDLVQSDVPRGSAAAGLPRVGVNLVTNTAAELEKLNMSAGGPGSPSRRALPSASGNARVVASAEEEMAKAPVLELERVVGYGGAYERNILWTHDATAIIYPCHSLIIIAKPETGEQRHLLGHTDAVCALALNGDGTLLASAQDGRQPIVRIWDVDSGKCLSVLKAHHCNVTSLAFSEHPRRLCGSGQDAHGRTLLALWDISRLGKDGRVTVIATQLTDYDIGKVAFSPYEEGQIVTCGRQNVRFWRLKNAQIRGSSLNLEKHYKQTFTDLAFESVDIRPLDPTGKRIFVSTASGMVFQANCETRVLECIFQLHDEAITSIAVNEGFCVTGSIDSYIRFWPLDFSDFYVEAQHEGPVTSVALSRDCMTVAVGVATGTIGLLDVPSHNYTTFMRSHTDLITAVALDPHHREFSTVSADGSIRVWDLDTFDQLYEFNTPNDCGLSLVYHPQLYVLACGFESGVLRVLDIASTSLLEEYQQHQAAVLDVVYSPDGRHLYSAGQDGTVCMFDVQRGYLPVKMLASPGANTKVSMDLSVDGSSLAVIGPDALSVVVFDAATMETRDKINTGGRFAAKVAFSPNGEELLVLTNSESLLRYNVASHTLLAEVTHVHKSGCLALTTSRDGSVVVTGGRDRIVKAWPAHLKEAINGSQRGQFQAFVGHSGAVTDAKFTLDNRHLLSVGAGDSVLVWRYAETAQLAQAAAADGFRPADIGPMAGRHGQHGMTWMGPGEFDGAMTAHGSASVAAPLGRMPMVNEFKDLESRVAALPANHYLPVRDTVPLAQRRYVASPESAGLRLRTVIGFSGNGHDNMVWLAETGLLAYTSGCLVIKEELDTHLQTFYVGHTDVVSVLAVSPDGGLIASGCGAAQDVTSSAVRVWPARPGSLTEAFGDDVECVVLPFHERGVQSLAFSPDSSLLVSLGAYLDPTLAVWDLSDGGALLTRCRLPCIMNQVKFQPSSNIDFVTVGEGQRVSFWLLTEERTLKVHDLVWTAPPASSGTNEAGVDVAAPFHVTSIEFDQDNPNLMVLGSSHGLVSLWNLEWNELVATFASRDRQEIDTIHWAGDRVLTGGTSPHLQSWPVVDVLGEDGRGAADVSRMLDGSHGKLVSSIVLDGAAVAMSLDASGTEGVVATRGGSLVYVTVPPASLQRAASTPIIQSHTDRITASVWAQDGSHLMTASEDGSLRVWVGRRSQQVMQFQVYDGNHCTALAVPQAQDDRVLVAGYLDGTLKIFGLPEGDARLRCKPHKARIEQVLFGGNGDASVVVSATAFGEVALTNRHNGLVTRRLFDHEGFAIDSLHVSPHHDGLLLASSSDGHVTVWSVAWETSSVAVALDYQVGRDDGVAGVDEQGEDEQGPMPTLALFSPVDDNQILIAAPGSASGERRRPMVLFYDFVLRRTVRSLELNQPASTMAASPGGELLAVGTADRLVKLIDFEEGTFQDFVGHIDRVSTVAFSPDVSRLASTSHDEILMWDVTVQTRM